VNTFKINIEMNNEKALTRGDLIVHVLAKVRGQQKP